MYFAGLNFMQPTGDLALIGLAVMGQNLILNMNDHGFTIVAYNRTVDKVDHFLANEAKGTKVLGAHSIAEMRGLSGDSLASRAPEPSGLNDG